MGFPSSALTSEILTWYLLVLKRQNGAYSLRNDVNFVTDKLIELAGSGDPIATEKWKSERRENIYNRRTVSLPYGCVSLQAYLLIGLWI